jgi:hypothetical protein
MVSNISSGSAVPAASGVRKNGDEKFHKYFTLGRRTVDSCDSYQPMGDTKTFMKELKATLPTRDEIYGEQED